MEFTHLFHTLYANEETQDSLISFALCKQIQMMGVLVL